MKNLVICVLLFALVVPLTIDYEPKSQANIVAAQVLPSIVKIENLAESTMTLTVPGLPPKVMTFYRTNGAGTGVIVANGNYVTTCWHVVEGAARYAIYVQGSDKPINANLVYKDEAKDIAILKLDTDQKFKPVTISSKAPSVGDDVYVAGHPLGRGVSFTRGMVNALHDELNDSIVTDASANPGNSGGALFNKDGELIGIVWALLSPRPPGAPPAFNGITLAYPVDRVTEVLPEAVAIGEALVPYH